MLGHSQDQNVQTSFNVEQTLQVGNCQEKAAKGRELNTSNEYFKKIKGYDELVEFSSINYNDRQVFENEKNLEASNNDFELFKGLLEGSRDVDIYTTILNESMDSFTNTIVDDNTRKPRGSATEAKYELTYDDLDTLNQIMTEINDLNTPTIEQSEPNVSEAFGDYNLVDFDAFESNIQISDPMLGNNQLNIYWL